MVIPILKRPHITPNLFVMGPFSIVFFFLLNQPREVLEPHHPLAYTTDLTCHSSAAPPGSAPGPGFLKSLQVNTLQVVKVVPTSNDRVSCSYVCS